MDNEKLTKAVELKKKIDSMGDIIKNVEILKIKTPNRMYITKYDNNSVVVPECLKSAFIAMLKEHYESELHELEQEFEEL